MSTSEEKTFLITGVSSGLGRALAEAALEDGHRVVGTVRGEADAASFEALAPPRSLARLLDVTDGDAVWRAVEEIEREVAPIDVLVANAGYGHEGTVEESTMDDLRRQFEVNVFGAVASIKAVLPQMRERRAGHIFVITSMGGLITMPGIAFYHGSKFAMEGISESLAKEVAGLGIRVTAVAPGSFRTEWAGRSMVRSPRSITDYDEVFDPQRERREAASGAQLGDPARAARAILEVLAAPDPPVHLVLGSDALRLIAAGRAEFDRDVAAWRELSSSTDFADGAQIS